MSPRDVVLLGSTGSVGQQAVEVLRANPGRFRCVGLAGSGNRSELIARQAAELAAPVVAVAQPAAAKQLADVLPGVRLLAGPDAAAELAGTPADVVLNAITGSVGLAPTLAALASGATLALANKESLVVGGPLVRAAMRRPDQIVPVDSEHSALAQCLRAGRREEVRRLVLTASGGPFRGRRRAELTLVTPAEALAHPTWSMGPVVTINSATLVNKGLELIEAHLLFGVPYADIEVVVHPQSVLHSLVEFRDGSTLAQLSPPDMRLPIALGLSWPDRLADVAPAVDWTQSHSWQLLPLDDEAFPAVGLARAAGERAGTAPAALNAANEEAVAAFLAGRLPFLEIVPLVAEVVAGHQYREAPTLAEVLAVEDEARDRARSLVGSEVAR